MTIDRYTRVVLTAIAIALVYLCVVLTPIPAVHAQRTAARPGDPTDPAEVVIVGWRSPQGQSFPVHLTSTAPVQVLGEVRVIGQVTTEQRERTADRVVLVGWEEGASARGPGRSQSLRVNMHESALGLPVTQTPAVK